MTDSDVQGPLTLREAVAAGLFPTIEAARKKQQRYGFRPVGTHNGAALFDMHELSAHVESKARSTPVAASDIQPGTWAPVHGAGYYEACSVGGRVRSVKRAINGRTYEGVDLTPKRTGTSRYWQVKLTFDDGKQRTVPVGVLVLLAHVGEPEPGQHCCHGDDNPDNNDLANLRWDWPEGNREDRKMNTPPKPKQVKDCIRCGEPFTGNGRRCHACVVEIGIEAAALLRGGSTLEDAAESLEYPSVSGLHTLAVKYGGYGQSRSRRVRKRLGRWLAGGDGP